MYPHNSVYPEALPPSFEEAVQSGYYPTPAGSFPTRLQPLPLAPSVPPPYEPFPYQQTNFGVSNSIEVPIPVNRPDSDAGGFTAGRSFEEKDVRRGFVKKVFGILSLQLLVTFAIVCLFTFTQSIREFMASRAYLVFVAGGVVIGVFVTIACSKGLQRKSPQNLLAICVMTLAMSFLAGTIASYFSTEAVVVAFAISAGVCFLVAILSWWTRLDAAGWSGCFFILVFVIIWFGIVSVCTYQQTWYIQVVYGFIGAFLFAMFLSYDINKILGKEDEYSPEDHVLACITIYTDIVMVFLFILLVCAAGGGGGGN